MAIAQPRPTPAPATPLRLFLEGHRRRFVYIVPELIYAVVGLLIVYSIIAFVRAMIKKGPSDRRKAHVKAGRYLDSSSSDFEMTMQRPGMEYECLASSSKSEPWQSHGGHGSHMRMKTTKYGRKSLNCRGAAEVLDHDLENLRWMRK